MMGSGFNFPLSRMMGNSPMAQHPSVGNSMARIATPVAAQPQNQPMFQTPQMPGTGGVSPLAMAMLGNSMPNSQPQASPVGAIANAVRPLAGAYAMNRLGLLGK